MPSPIHIGRLSGTRWDPKQYDKFAVQRLRPALELLDQVALVAPSLIYDLGCGPGEVTRIIADRWPNAAVHGFDNSKEMLEKAAREPSRVEWMLADVRDWRPDAAPDLIYSNAVLHWVEGHEQLFPRLLGFLRPGGRLAVQMPQSWAAPSHRLMRETLANGGPGGAPLGSEALRAAVACNGVAEAAAYYDLLAPHAKILDIWETEYLHVLEGSDPVLEWVKGTTLRPVLHELAEPERETFLAELARRLRLAYPVRADGRTLLPFRRLFIVATV